METCPICHEVEREECDQCNCYHPHEFTGDCRQDNMRFATPCKCGTQDDKQAKAKDMENQCREICPHCRADIDLVNDDSIMHVINTEDQIKFEPCMATHIRN